MSILIKGMEMPFTCLNCDFHKCAGGVGDFCSLTKRRQFRFKNRPKDCPLIEVPELHGRLIDEENICDKLRPLIENPYCYNRLQIISETLAHCLQIISDAPTIIQSSEEGE